MERIKLLLILPIALLLAGCAAAPVPSAIVSRTGIQSSAPRSPLYRPGMLEWPVSGSVITTFGGKVDKVLSKGIDISSTEGAPVRAAKSGRVVFCDPQLKGFGNTVIIDHGNGYQTVYSYNSEIVTVLGANVEKGDIIAKVGRTGRAKSPSLHFEVRRNGEPEDPLHYLARR